MKHIISTALLALAFAPQALAQDRKDEGTPYAISLISDAAPLSLPDYSYPYRAGILGVGGECEVTFVVNAVGRADAIRVTSCSSELFTASAKRVVEQTTFTATGAARAGAKAIVRWKLEAPRTILARG